MTGKSQKGSIISFFNGIHIKITVKNAWRLLLLRHESKKEKESAF